MQEADRIRRVTSLLRDAERPVRVLRTIAWPEGTRERFFASGATELPEVAYQPIDPTRTLEAVAEARRHIDGGGAIDRWLTRLANVIETGARMLAAVGTADFHKRSRDLYGYPTAPLVDQVSTSLDLARQLDDVLSGLTHLDLGGPAEACHLSSGVAEQMRRIVRRHFGDDAPEVVVVEHLSSNALAGPKDIRIRRDACFTDRDVFQLVHHEAFVHVGTSLNGRAQKDLPILAAGHPGTTRTQEGLAVFGEFISGSIEPDRLRRLADRVLAIQMAIDGADFLDVYRFFLERTRSAEQAFENARRVFRGGLIRGGAPFTKDGVYLDGLLRVHNFLRCVVRAGRSDCLRLLFCGKLDIEDMPALCQLAELGLCRQARFLPPWAADLRFLVAYLAYSGFLNQVNLTMVQAHYTDLLSQAPPVAPMPAEA